MKNTYKYIILSAFLFTLGTLFFGCKKKEKLKDTVISLRDVKDIGELITAEYYGEVLTGLTLISQDSITQDLKEGFENIQEKAKRVDSVVKVEHRHKITKLDNIIKAASIPDTTLKDEDDIAKDTKKREKARLKALRKKRRLKRRMERKRIKRLRKEGVTASPELKNITKTSKTNKRDVIKEMVKSDWEDFTASRGHIKKEITKQIKKDLRNKQLAYIGRGSVKAGYDLTQITEENLFTSPNKDTIFILDIDPQLLNVDINPWFMLPQEPKDSTDKPDTINMYGFQMIAVSKQKNMTLAEMNRVKSECKSLLRKEALDRDIYEHAKVNAEETLKGLFAMITAQNEYPVKEVMFSHTKYFEDKLDILYDGVVDTSELHLMQDLVLDDTLEIDSQFYAHQDLEYQVRILDQFLVQVYKQTSASKNCDAWRPWIEGYFRSKNIVADENNWY